MSEIPSEINAFPKFTKPTEHSIAPPITYKIPNMKTPKAAQFI
jgi:hypothetical protein